MIRNTTLLAATLLAACPVDEPAAPCAIDGLPSPLDGSVANPFPSMHLVAPRDDGRCALAIEDGDLPAGESGALPVSRLGARDGFSPVQPAVLRAGVPIDRESLPPWTDPAASLAETASVFLVDLATGERLPCFAETDAYADQGEDERALIVRPLRRLPPGGHVGVVMTDGVTVRGEPYRGPSDFLAIRDGDGDTTGLPGLVVAHYEALLDRLSDWGVDLEHVAFAWDFPVASIREVQAPLVPVRQAMEQALPLDPAFAPSVTWDAELDADTAGPDDPAPVAGLWREGRGAVRLPHYLWDEDDGATEVDHEQGRFRLGGDGLPIERGDGDVFFHVALPDSVRGAAPGSVPVLVFGHGIFSSPREYLASSTDANSIVRLLGELGAIGIGTEWRGLTERDRPDALRAAGDLADFPLITDKLVQGVSDQLAMARLMRTGFADSPLLQAASGGSLVDADRIHYMGISLGGIEGTTFLAQSDVVDAGVLHVPGCAWSTMLERSTHWLAFEPFVATSVPSPPERQVLYAAMQLLWDAVDPINHVDGLVGKSALWQVSIGDEQVPNFTAELMMRTIGALQLTPSVTSVWGLSPGAAPLGPGAQAMAQFDPQLGAPPLLNRPGTLSGAHAAIRQWDALHAQVVAFFEAGAVGTVVDPCGGPCVGE
jgi:hypothetical protein